MSNISIESFDRYILMSNSSDSHHNLASHRAKLPKSYHQILDFIPSYLQENKIKNPHILDLAMGFGDTSRYLESCNFNVIKADLSFSALKNIDGLKSRCRADELPFRTESFDAIHFKDALVHVENMDKLFSEFNRILKPNGVLLLTTAENPYGNFNYYYRENNMTLCKNISFDNLATYCRLVNQFPIISEAISINPPYFRVNFKEVEDSLIENNFKMLESLEWRRRSNEPDWYRGKMPRMVYFAEKQ